MTRQTQASEANPHHLGPGPFDPWQLLMGAELAHQLIASLDSPVDDLAVVAAESSAEAARRLVGIEAQTTTGIPWDQLREQLKS